MIQRPRPVLRLAHALDEAVPREHADDASAFFHEPDDLAHGASANLHDGRIKPSEQPRYRTNEGLKVT